MNKNYCRWMGCVALGFVIATAQPLAAQYVLPDYMKTDLARIEETWNILDQCAGRIWPGWKNYMDVPFRLNYPNGVQLLIGHPSPTDGFELVPGVELRGKKIYVDRRNQIPLELKQPLSGGGGIISYGKDKLVAIVDLNIGPLPPEDVKKPAQAEKAEPEPKELKTASENQILINIHELFHCFQREVYRYRYGNIQANADANYAIYAEVEGLALEKAYLEPSPDKAKDDLKDFLAARTLKRRSLNEEEQNQESEDELMEGTAVYSEAMSLELMKKGYKPRLTAAEDPYFLGFKHIDHYLQEKLESLKNSRADSMDVRMKCYPFGCFQALLLSRYFPGWQTGFFEKGKFLDQVLAESLGFTAADMEKTAKGLADRYPIREISDKHAKVIQKRDDALKMIQARKGRVYIVNFKPTREFLSPKSPGETYRIGLIVIYPEGIERIKIQDVLFEGKLSPIIQDQLYYVKWIDTEAKANDKGYVLKYGRKEGKDVYFDAEFTTKGFTLKAPKIQVRDLPTRVKVTVLGKVKQGPASGQRD
jgi:hypothetical protein